MLSPKPYIRRVGFYEDLTEELISKYPFNIPSIRDLEQLDFHPDVTFIVGENGCGKSTFLEALALSLGFNAEGGTKNYRFETRNTHSDLHEKLKVIKGFKQPQDGYFFRAESFYNLATEVDEMENFQGYGGKSLHEQSHGEAFMSMILNKLRGNGLYLMDEPEAALSPNRQLWALGAIDQLVKKASQFVIVTHSPIILAYPNATIYVFDENGVRPCAYEDTQHYLISKAFFENRQLMLDRIFEES